KKKKKKKKKNSITLSPPPPPGSFRSIPATFVAPCSSLTTFPLALRPIVHPELLLPAHTTPM
ncbi:hypothetical protein, partial [Escherichia coli]|uniref:hypothetical protein n=1 Tax=Escherichia coli TaxID=562 RepID=UPI0019D70C7E